MDNPKSQFQIAKTNLHKLRKLTFNLNIANRYKISLAKLYDKYTALSPILKDFDDPTIKILIEHISAVLNEYYDHVNKKYKYLPPLPYFAVNMCGYTITYTVHDNKIYSYNLSCTTYDINSIKSKILLLNNSVDLQKPDNEKATNAENAYTTLYNCFCDSIKLIQNNKLLSYTLYILYNYDNIPLKNIRLYDILPIPDIIITANTFYLPCSDPFIKYILLGKKPMIISGYEMYGVYPFFKKQPDIPQKLANIMPEYIELLCNHIKTHCIQYTCPEYSIYLALHNSPFIYPESSEQYQSPECVKISFKDHSVSAEMLIFTDNSTSKDNSKSENNRASEDNSKSKDNNTPQRQYLEPFRQFHVHKFHFIPVISNYRPTSLCQCLCSMCNDAVDISIVDEISMLLASCTVNKLTHRKITIISCNKDNMYTVKTLFKNIISSLSMDNNIIIDRSDKEDSPLTLQEFSSSIIVDKLKENNYSFIRAYFIENNSDDNLSKYKQNNLNEATSKLLAPIIIFQPFYNVSYLTPSSYNRIDLSEWVPNNNATLPRYDRIWAMIYLSIYGLSLIFKKRKNEFQFTVTSKDDNTDELPTQDENTIISELSENFISQYFVDTDTAEARKKERKKQAQEYKDANPNLTSEELNTLLTAELAKIPLFSTFVSDFKEYAKYYIESQLTPSQIDQYNITSDRILNYVKTNMGYEAKSSNIKYVKNKRGTLILDKLSLKDTWEKTREEIDKARKVQPSMSQSDECLKKIEKLVDDLIRNIDFSKIPTL